MAATWVASQSAVGFVSPKDMLNVFCGGQSAKAIRCTRFWVFNGQSVRNIGASVLATLQIRRIRSASGINSNSGWFQGGGAGTLIPQTPLRYDQATAPIDPAITVGSGQTVPAAGSSNADVFRQVVWCTENPFYAAAATIDAWEALLPNALIFEAGFADSNVEPIVCRAGFGSEIYHVGSSAAGEADCEIEFNAF